MKVKSQVPTVEEIVFTGGLLDTDFRLKFRGKKGGMG